MARLVIVSNRVAIADESGKATAGGLATALREALQVHGGTWFGWSGKVTAKPSPAPHIVEKGRSRYAVMDLSPVDHREYYNGFANSVLWPIMHYRIGLTDFSRADFAGYRRVNRNFAAALAGLIEPGDLVWVHDYHLIPLASELRALGVSNSIGYFHHIPWPAPEVFGTLPGSLDLLRSIAAYDLVGVHTEDDCDNLKRGLVRELGAKPLKGDRLDAAGRQTRVKALPIGIDVKGFGKAAERAGSHATVRETIRSLGSRKLLIGVDRLDYSKGVPERMEAVERFLISNPDQRGRVVYLQIAPKTRVEVPEYATLSRAVNDMLGHVNGSLGDPGWVPIHYVTKAYPRSVLAGLYRHARVGLVTPMRDGMNLVAKEFVAAQNREDPGVLILSKFAGAARQLTDALIVNPYDKFEMSEAIRQAIYMDLDERVARWRGMYKTLVERDISWWTETFLKELVSTKARAPAAKPSRASPPALARRKGRLHRPLRRGASPG